MNLITHSEPTHSRIIVRDARSPRPSRSVQKRVIVAGRTEFKISTPHY